MTANLRAVIVKQFVEGDATVPYLASLYKVPQDKVEHAIRMRLIELETRILTELPPKDNGRASEKETHDLLELAKKEE